MEQGIMLLFKQKYNSSLLHGPWTIVYGVATLIILMLGDYISKLEFNKYIKFIIFFIICFLVLSSLEGIAGLLIEKILGIVYWDYSDIPLHFGKYICVPVSLIWTIYACVLNYLVYPWAKKLIKKVPKIITYILIVLFLIDIGYTTMEYLKYQ